MEPGVLGAWTFGGELWEHVTEDEVDWATGVLLTAWEAARAKETGAVGVNGVDDVSRCLRSGDG